MFEEILKDKDGYYSNHLSFLPSLQVRNSYMAQLRYQGLPTVCSVVAATSLAPEHGSTAVMAATVASMSCWGSILAGLLAGWIVSLLVSTTCESLISSRPLSIGQTYHGCSSLALIILKTNSLAEQYSHA